MIRIRVRDLFFYAMWTISDRINCALGRHVWNKGFVIQGARVRCCERCGLSHIAMEHES